MYLQLLVHRKGKEVPGSYNLGGWMMMRNSCFVLLTALVFIGVADFAIAMDQPGDAHMQSEKKSTEFWIHGGVEAWAGEITYRIGYPVTEASGQRYYGYFPFSELEFPLDAAFGVVKAGAVLGNRVVINAQIKTNVSDPDDDMIDRDWTSSSYPWRLDIYSKSEVTGFDALVLDGDVSYKVFDSSILWLAVGAGYMYEDFEYETALKRQWSPSGLPGNDYFGDGRTTLIYEVESNMPYLLVRAKFNIIEKLKINARLGFAPWVEVEDRDQHLLRDKVSVGEMDGSAVMVSVDTQYDFTPQLFVTGGLSHTYIDVDGDMEASFNGVYDHTVEEELTSRQTSVFLTVGFRFGVPAGT